MSRSTHWLRRKLNNGWNKMNKKPFHETTDKHGKLLPSEVGYEEMEKLFLCSNITVRFFIKMVGIKPVRKSNQMMAFDKEEVIEKLSPLMKDGRLTRIGMCKKPKNKKQSKKKAA